MKAKCLEDGCRFLAVAKHNGTCGLPDCLYNPILVQSFVDAVLIKPKSDIANDYYVAIMDGRLGE